MATDGIELSTDSQELEVGPERTDCSTEMRCIRNTEESSSYPGSDTPITTHSLSHRLRYLQHLNSSARPKCCKTTLQLVRTVSSDSLNGIDDDAETEEYFILYFSRCQFSSRCSVNQCAQQTDHFYQSFNNVPLVEKSAEKDTVSVRIAELSNKA